MTTSAAACPQLTVAAGADVAIACRSVTVRYGTARAVERASMDVPRGRVHGLLGPNGAGKTTLLRVLFGLVRPDDGQTDVLGTTPAAATARAPHGLAGFVETPRFYPYLSATRNLALLAALDDTDARDRIPELLDQVGLGDRGRQKVSGFSAGQRQRLGLAAALLREPDLLVLDEPTTGLDPVGVRDLHGVIAGMVERGATVLLSSHDMAEVELLCTSVTVLVAGRTVFDGPLDVLCAEAPDPTYLLTTGDDIVARTVLDGCPGVAIDQHPDGELIVRAGESALDDAVLALGRSGVAVRSMRRQDTALEAMFLRLCAEHGAPDGMTE